jgi:hypothetical protein
MMNKDILGILTNKDAIAINQQYAGNAGDALSEFNCSGLVDALVDATAGDNSSHALDLPPQPMAVMTECKDSDPLQQWTMDQRGGGEWRGQWTMDQTDGHIMDQTDGHICAKAGPLKGKCFNNQDCKGPIILYEFSSKGCGQGKNEKFMQLSATPGPFHSALHPTQCLEPSGQYNQLFDTECNPSHQWTYDNSTCKIAMVNANSTTSMCVTQHAQPPAPSPSPAKIDPWYKPLPGNTAALAVLNSGSTAIGPLKLSLVSLPLVKSMLDIDERHDDTHDARTESVSCDVMDVWTKATTKVTDTISIATLGPMSAYFVKLSGCSVVAAPTGGISL